MRNEILHQDEYYTILDVSTPRYPYARTIVDNDVVELISQWNWSVHNESGFLYVRSSDSKGVRLPRIIMNTPPELVVDHINGNTLINIKSNLKNCTQHQNCMKQRNSGKIRGIRFSHGKYEVSIETLGKAFYLGRYTNLGEAKRVYNKAAIILFGDFAVLHETEEQ